MTDYEMLKTFGAGEGLGCGDFERALERLLWRAAQLLQEPVVTLYYSSEARIFRLVRSRDGNSVASGKDLHAVASDLLQKYSDSPTGFLWEMVAKKAAVQVADAKDVGPWHAYADVKALLAEKPDRLQWFSPGHNFSEDDVVLVEPPDADDPEMLVFVQDDRGSHGVSLAQSMREGDRVRGVWK